MGLPPRGRRRLHDLCWRLADHPFVFPDFVAPDERGRSVSHLVTGDYEIVYWVDHAVKTVIVTELEYADA